MGRKSTVNVVVVGDATKLRESLADADRQLSKFGDATRGESEKLKDFGRKATIAAGVAAVGMWKMADAAGDLGESTSKASTTFGNSFKAIEGWADGAADSMGQSKKEALDNASAFGLLGKSAGLGGKELEKFSTGLTELATDFASFHNTSVPEAAEALQSAFRGEFDSLQRYIPQINAAAVQQEALAMGLANSTSELTAQDKIVATQAFVMKNAGDAVGDFARTSESAANQQRKLKAEFANLAAETGEKLLPTMSKVLSAGGKMIDVFDAIPEPVQNTAIMVGVAATGLAGLGGALSSVAGWASDAKDAFSKAKDAIGQKGLSGVLTPTTGAVVGLTAAIGAGLAIWDAWHTNMQRVKDEARGVADAVIEMDEDAIGGLNKQLQNVLETRDSFDESFRQFGLTFGDATRLVDENIGAIDDFRHAMHDGFESALGKGMTTSQASTVAMEKMRDAVDDLPPAYRSVIQARLDMVDAGELEANAFKETIDALVDTDQAAQETADRFRYFGQQLDDTVPKAGRSKEAVQLFDRVLGDTGSLEDRQEAFRWLIRMYPEAAQEAGLSVDAHEEVADAVADVGDEAVKTSDALKDYQDQLAASIDPLFGVMDATDDLRDAQAKFDEVRKESAVGSLEYEEALRDVSRAAMDLEFQQDQLAAGVRDGSIKIDDANASLRRWKDQGKITEGQAKELQQRFFFLAVMAEETGKKRINIPVKADTSQAVAALASVGTQIDNLRVKAGAAQMIVTGGLPRELQGRASGGPVTGGTPYVIGEEGPEIFVPSVNGTVIPNDKLSGASGGRPLGGTSIVINVHAGVGDPVEIGRQVAESLRAYERHGGSVPA